MFPAGKLIYSRYFLSLIAAIIIVFICLLTTDKYRAEILSSRYQGPNLSFFYHDFDNDGRSERVELHKYLERMVSVLVYNNEKLIYQRDYEGDFGRSNSAIINIHDYDKDGSDEIILFTQFKDSLYLNSFDVTSSSDEFYNVPICEVYTMHDIYSYQISPIETYDVDMDGIKEFFFSVWSGYIGRPRKMFSYYPAEGKLYVSPENCAIIRTVCISDLDNDGTPEIFGSNHAPGNCGLEQAYTDLYGWLMVFTPEMDFKFPPVIVGEYPSKTDFLPLRVRGSNYILAYHDYEGNEDLPDYLALFDAEGSEVLKRELSPEENLSEAFLFTGKSDNASIYIHNLDGQIFRVRENLETDLVAEIGIVTAVLPMHEDLDRDGNPEYVFISYTRKELVICRSNFSHPVNLAFPENLDKVRLSLIIKPEKKKPEIIVETPDNSYTVNYGLTIIHKYWYIFALSVYAACLLILFMYHKILEYRLIKLSHTRNRIVELQLKSIQNQIDPHFTLNLFQSFATLISEKDTEKAEFLFDRYAVLLKTTVLNSEKLFIPLQEELNFITSYLDLENFKGSYRFDYSLDIQDDIDTGLKIPKMLLFTFVENALKHGLRHLDSGGELSIEAQKRNGIVHISISDNGIGRKKAAEYADLSTGRGLSIIDQILDLYYSMNRIRISYDIIDLMNDHTPAGTQVNIRIPL